MPNEIPVLTGATPFLEAIAASQKADKDIILRSIAAYVDGLAALTKDALEAKTIPKYYESLMRQQLANMGPLLDKLTSNT